MEIVKDRAETAEDELERLITEINENQESSNSSEKNSSSPALSRVSTGSDDVFDGSPAEKSQFAAFWEVINVVLNSKLIYLIKLQMLNITICAS